MTENRSGQEMSLDVAWGNWWQRGCVFDTFLLEEEQSTWYTYKFTAYGLLTFCQIGLFYVCSLELQKLKNILDIIEYDDNYISWTGNYCRQFKNDITYFWCTFLVIYVYSIVVQLCHTWLLNILYSIMIYIQ